MNDKKKTVTNFLAVGLLVGVGIMYYVTYMTDPAPPSQPNLVPVSGGDASIAPPSFKDNEELYEYVNKKDSYSKEVDTNTNFKEDNPFDIRR